MTYAARGYASRGYADSAGTVWPVTTAGPTQTVAIGTITSTMIAPGPSIAEAIYVGTITSTMVAPGPNFVGQLIIVALGSAGPSQWVIGPSIVEGGTAPAPTGLTVTPTGTAGTTTYVYWVTSVDSTGTESAASVIVTITTGNATLSATNYNALSWTAVTGAVSYRVYGRTAGGEVYLASTTTTTYADVGAAAPAPVPYRSQITCGLYDRLGNLIVALPNSFARKWQGQLSNVGNGEATIQYTDSAVPTVDYRQLLRFTLNSNAAFSAVVEQIDREVIKPGEEHDEIVVLKGRGTLAILEEAVVYPELGLGALPFSDTRTFSYVSTAYDDSAWGNALLIKQQSSAAAPYANAPAVWPDGQAWWIWGQGGTGPYQIGDCYFRHTFSLSAETTVRFAFSADDGIEVWLDGARLAQDTQAFLWGTTKTADVFITAGTHTVAIRGINIPRPNNAATNVAAVILTAMVLNADGTLGAVLVHTDQTWTCLAYPVDGARNDFTDGVETAGSVVLQSASGDSSGIGYTFVPTDVGRAVTGGDIQPGTTIVSYVNRNTVNMSGPSSSSHTGLGISLFGHPYEPGFTPGALLRILVSEAQNRGALVHVVLGFSDSADSAGKPWPLMGSTSFQCGLDLLSVVLQLAESYLDVSMDVGTTTLRAYGALGTDQSVTLAAGTNLTELAFAGQT